jgi:hypothetical protein
MGFFDALGDSYSLTVLAFVLVSASIFASGGSYSNAPLIGWLGLLYYIPMSFVLTLGGSASAALLPLLVIAFFAYVVVVNKLVGPIEGLIMMGFVALVLGA